MKWVEVDGGGWETQWQTHSEGVPFWMLEGEKGGQTLTVATPSGPGEYHWRGLERPLLSRCRRGRQSGSREKTGNEGPTRGGSIQAGGQCRRGLERAVPLKKRLVFLPPRRLRKRLLSPAACAVACALTYSTVLLHLAVCAICAPTTGPDSPSPPPWTPDLLRPWSSCLPRSRSRLRSRHTRSKVHSNACNDAFSTAGTSYTSAFSAAVNMVLPPVPSFFSSTQDVDPSTPQQVGLDSITLGQLKAMVGSAPKPKVWSGSRFPMTPPPSDSVRK